MSTASWSARIRAASHSSNDLASTDRQVRDLVAYVPRTQVPMKVIARALAALGACVSLPSSYAADTTTFTYDALGRLVQSQVSGGARHGVQQNYQYDPATNLTYRNILGPANPRPAPVTAPTTTVSSMGGNGALVVNVGGTSPTGTVTFTIDGMFVAIGQVLNGQARASVVGLQPGSYTVTATYSGDGNNDPTTSTFVVQVRDLSWLPAILDLILTD